MRIPQRKHGMTDLELTDFLKSIKTEIEKDCWVTNYYKTTNYRGQARLYYKSKNIYLHQLSHLLFNGDRSNLNSIFHKCNNLICFNPTHLTDDLKEKRFKLSMSSSELFEGCPTKKDKRKILINYGNWLSKELRKPLVYYDFEVTGRINSSTITTYFGGSMANYFNSCDFLPARRKLKMPDSEMKEFLKAIKIETEKGCWITDYWKNSTPDGRIKIKYKGKMQFLPRVSYGLFTGNIPNKLVVMHKCDNPPCFSPEHLVIGTKQDNSRDAANKGRLGLTKSEKRKPHKIINPYDYKSLLNFIKQHIEITEKNEWIFAAAPSQEYPPITINKKHYQLHRLLLANKLGKKYEDIKVACHRLPDGSKPNKHDVNPDHLFEGTHSENILDTVKYHKGYKLSYQLAEKIRKAAKKYNFSKKGSKKRFDKEWAAKLDVSRTCIKNIRLNKSWNQHAKN